MIRALGARRLASSLPAELAERIVAGERAALAKGITLIESTHPKHEEAGRELLSRVLALHKAQTERKPSLRIGISGAPGVGKSTFIEGFGSWLAERDERLAVLAVDPSSARTGGSILGDRTRMTELSRNPKAFIRSTPSRGILGGVARNTSEAMALCEAAGFSVVLVETVGVGQSEYAVSDMVDMFMLLASPGGGDELQGIKRGVMELADLVVVTKADGALARAANIAKAEYVSALQLMRPKYETWRPATALVSSLERRGYDTVWAKINEFFGALRATGELDEKRRSQLRSRMWTIVQEALIQRVTSHPDLAAFVREHEAKVIAGELAPSAAALRIVERFQAAHSR